LQCLLEGTPNIFYFCLLGNRIKEIRRSTWFEYSWWFGSRIASIWCQWTWYLHLKGNTRISL